MRSPLAHRPEWKDGGGDAEAHRLGGGLARDHRPSQRRFELLMPWAILLPIAGVRRGKPYPRAGHDSHPGRAAGALRSDIAAARDRTRRVGEKLADGLIAALEQSASAALIARPSPRGDGRSRQNHVRMHGIRLPVRSGPPTALHRISRRRWALDANFYDLLASEARLASFIAIAKGDLPAKHWFRLGRTLTPIDGGSG